MLLCIWKMLFFPIPIRKQQDKTKIISLLSPSRDNNIPLWSQSSWFNTIIQFIDNLAYLALPCDIILVYSTDDITTIELRDLKAVHNQKGTYVFQREENNAYDDAGRDLPPQSWTNETSLQNEEQVVVFASLSFREMHNAWKSCEFCK